MKSLGEYSYHEVLEKILAIIFHKFVTVENYLTTWLQ